MIVKLFGKMSESANVEMLLQVNVIQLFSQDVKVTSVRHNKKNDSAYVFTIKCWIFYQYGTMKTYLHELII